jgi:uncharacterized protein involved in exopolysaccharide biosynthesis
MLAAEIVISILAGLISMLAGGVASSGVFEDLLRKILKRKAATVSYAERLSKLMQSLRESSSEVDSVLKELSTVAAERQSAASRLEQQLKDLETKEETLQQRIRHLQAVPIPVAEYFAELTKSGERRNARRDYMLFGAGVVVSTLISIVFFLLQGR